MGQAIAVDVLRGTTLHARSHVQGVAGTLADMLLPRLLWSGAGRLYQLRGIGRSDELSPSPETGA